MSELISGKDALIKLANGFSVEACVSFRKNKDEWHWFDAKNLTVNEIEAMETEGDPDGGNVLAIAFRLKPKTITLNNNELPKPISIAWGDPHKTAVELDFKNEDEAHEFHRLFSSLFL